MLELYRAVKNCGCREDAIVFTVLEGEELGEKALVLEGRLLWESRTEGFFSRNLEEAGKIKESGVVEISGRQVFCDALGNEKKIVVCGGGHVAMSVIQIGRMIDCEIIVLEDRPKFADDARRAGASRVICESFEAGLEQIAGDKDTYFVIVTRGHSCDLECLRKIIEKPHAYIGMIGSRKRTSAVKKKLEEEGAAREILDRIYTPIGLDIGAETPAEIGVAILAEIIEVKNKKKRTGGYSKEILKEILTDREFYTGKVLATIVRKKGSAPQGIGVKMLIRQDGTCVGTIGGGCMEAAVIRKALQMMMPGAEAVQVCRADLTGLDAEEEGMVCGGTADILLERIE